jgi:hypothetical protein
MLKKVIRLLFLSIYKLRGIQKLHVEMQVIVVVWKGAGNKPVIRTSTRSLRVALLSLADGRGWSKIPIETRKFRRLDVVLEAKLWLAISKRLSECMIVEWIERSVIKDLTWKYM